MRKGLERARGAIVGLFSLERESDRLTRMAAATMHETDQHRERVAGESGMVRIIPSNTGDQQGRAETEANGRSAQQVLRGLERVVTIRNADELLAQFQPGVDHPPILDEPYDWEASGDYPPRSDDEVD